ncbi:MAG: dephospho-CoA kinase [Sphingobacteriales bacterium]|nr:MAG: dephospho-CoA kinase [Sphingobacteriales bacterium]
MYKVGITGGIGSGKTTVAKIFEVLGIPVYYADDAAKRLMNEDPVLKAAIIKAFGENAYTNNTLNRSYLAAAVFNNTEKTALLNSLVHPVTIKDAANWVSRQNSAYTLKEAALIFESGTQAQYDFIIGVAAPKALRLHRAMQRNNSTKEQVMQRMQNQIEESIKLKLCNVIITNNEVEPLLPQVLQLHQQLLNNAQKI